MTVDNTLVQRGGHYGYFDASYCGSPCLSRRLNPLITLAPAFLLERLVAEYVYAQLCEAAMHGFEAENEARMLAMASAKNNIESKLANLSQRERQLRQEQITTEIVELAGGAEALTEPHA